MKKFRFKLQKLLDIRIKKEDMIKQQFAQALQKFEQEKLHLASSRETLGLEQQQQKQRRLSGIQNSLQEAQFQGYLNLLRNNVTRAGIQMSMAQNVVDKKREELIVAQKDRKIIEELKTKQFDEYRLMVDKEENKVIDEIATMGAARENEFVMRG